MDLLDVFHCEHPIMQAGMADISRARLASAVTVAGGIGTIGLSAPAQFEVDILDTKDAVGDRTFAANLLMPFVTRTHIDICIRNRVPVVSLFFGFPKTVVQALQQAGSQVLVQIGSVDEAKRALRLGVDGLIVQGNEAGGHVRGDERLNELLPKVRDAAADIPIFAAGGIHDRATVQSALELGADAVSCGTRFLMTAESFAHEEYKKRLLDAQSTVLTQLFGVSWPDKHRVVPNLATQRWTENGSIPAWLHLLHKGTRILARAQTDRRKYVSRQSLDLPVYTPSPLKPGMDSQAADVTALYAGECVAEISDQLTAAEVVQRLAA